MDANEIQKGLEAKFGKVQDELDELNKGGKATAKDIAEATKAMKTQGVALQNFIDGQKEAEVQDFETQFGAFLDENKEELNKIAKNKSGVIEFTPDLGVDKAVGDMTTGSGSDIDTPPTSVSTRLHNINYRNDNPLINLCTTFSTNQPAFGYTEVIPKEGGYAFVAEGIAKPQIDFTWENRYASPEKIAAYEIFTEESIKDYPRLMSVAKDFLRKRHDLFKADGLYFGTGVSPQVTGATVYGRTFVATGLTDVFANGTANFMDIVNSIITDIYRTHNYTDEMPYTPNVVLINPIDFFTNIQAAKTSTGTPLYPQASLFNSLTLGGVKIMPWTKIPAGKIFVADMSKYNISNYVPYSVRLGWINDQFITNKFTMVGESRFHAFVRNLDEQAFVYDDIATVLAAIEAV